MTQVQALQHAGGGNRTHTGVAPQGILSPSRLATFATPATSLAQRSNKPRTNGNGSDQGRSRWSCSKSVRAGNGTRTRDPNLGKVVLYQLSYSRVR
jgi:hypothetical protein